MGSTLRVSVASTLLYVSYVAALDGMRRDLIRSLTVELSAHFAVDCCVVFCGVGNGITDNFDIYKALSSNLKSSVGRHTFQDRWTGFERLRKFCSRPMNIIVGDGLKAEFAQFTFKNKMADEIWLVFLNTPPREFFEESRPAFDSEVIAVEYSNSEGVRLWEIYSVDENHPLRIVRFGTWSNFSGLSLPSSYIFQRRTDLEGKVVKVGSTENWPLCTFREEKWGGYFPDVWREVQSIINCTTVPVRSTDNATGIQFKNGSWNGLMGMLIKKEIDVIAAELTITKSRINFIRYCRPLFTARYQLYFKALGYNLEWAAIFKPLAVNSWLAICGWIFVATTCVTLCYSCYVRDGVEENPNINFSGTESFFFILQSLCQQGYPIIPKSLCLRIVFLTAYLLPAVIIPSYSASLISSLTYLTPKKPFDSLEEMLTVGNYKLIVRKNSAAYAQFAEASDPLYRKIYDRMMTDIPEDLRLKNSVDDLDNTICKHARYAYFDVNKLTELKMKYQSPKCRVLSLSTPLNPVSYSLAMRKDSPFSRLINFHLQKMYNYGVIARLKDNLRPLKEGEDVVFNEVEPDEIFQVFFLLLTGIFSGLLLLGIEKFLGGYNGQLSDRPNIDERNKEQAIVKHKSSIAVSDNYVH